MKIEAKLWPLEGEQDFKEIWPSDVVFELTWPIFNLDLDIIQTNTLVKFHEDWSKIVASRGWTRFKEIWPNDLVSELTWPIFNINRDVIRTNILVKICEDWSKSVASRGWTRFKEIWPSDLVFDPTWPIFKSDWDIIQTNILVKFHDDWSKTLASTEGEQGFREISPSDLVFDRTWPIFKFDLDITKTNILVKFHEDWNKTVASRGWMLTMDYAWRMYDRRSVITTAHLEHFMLRWAKKNTKKQNNIIMQSFHDVIKTLTVLWANSADDKLMTFFFPVCCQKKDFDETSCKLSH